MIRFLIVSAIWMLIGIVILIGDFLKVAYWVWSKTNGNDELYDNIGSVFVDYIFDVDLINANAVIFTIVIIFCWPYTIFRMETGIRKIWKNYISNTEES